MKRNAARFEVICELAPSANLRRKGQYGTHVHPRVKRNEKFYRNVGKDVQEST